MGGIILNAAITVHKELGPGLLESAYELALMYELGARGVKVTNQVAVPLKFRGHNLDKAYEIDLPVEEEVIVEGK